MEDTCVSADAETFVSGLREGVFVPAEEVLHEATPLGEAEIVGI
jgi:hypothetical protein